MTNPANPTFDYKGVRLFARRYLDTYYPTVNEDEPPIARFLLEKGREVASLHLAALEVGCGPTVHHALAIAPYLDSIDMADYLPDNLGEIRSWTDRRQDSFSWRPYTEMILREEGCVPSDAEVEHREHLLRSKIRDLYPCDVTQSPPLAGVEPYPLVLSFYCAEEVGTTQPAWEGVMRNIAMMNAPDGFLLLSALRGTSRYLLGDPEGAHEWLPCASITQGFLENCLQTIGYEPASIDIRSINTPSLIDLGIPGILIVYARKQPRSIIR